MVAPGDEPARRVHAAPEEVEAARPVVVVLQVVLGLAAVWAGHLLANLLPHP